MGPWAPRVKKAHETVRKQSAGDHFKQDTVRKQSTGDHLSKIRVKKKNHSPSSHTPILPIQSHTDPRFRPPTHPPTHPPTDPPPDPPTRPPTHLLLASSREHFLSMLDPKWALGRLEPKKCTKQYANSLRETILSKIRVQEISLPIQSHTDQDSPVIL